LEKLSLVISENLKKLRKERKLSLEELSTLTNVSKSMLRQIEKNEVNPTVTTVWKISNGLKISFTQLMIKPQTDIEIVKKDDKEPLFEDDNMFRSFPLFGFDPQKRFEMYMIEVEPNYLLQSQPHPFDTQEFITVFNGSLEMIIGDRKFEILKGESIRFKADIEHSYKNTSNEVCEMFMVIYYPE
jgi:transcriptional regulator with XRE-family HTH domain